MYLYSASFVIPLRKVDEAVKIAARFGILTDAVGGDDGMVLFILVHTGSSSGEDMVAATVAIAQTP